MVDWKAAQKLELAWWIDVKSKTVFYERETYWERLNRLHLVRGFHDHTIVDIGAGPDNGLIGMMGMRSANKLIIVDPLWKEYENHFKKEPGIEYLTAKIENLPFEDNSVDVVICTNTIDHVEDPKKGIKEIKRVLKDGGTAHIHVYLYRPHGDEKHPHEITFEDVVRWRGMFKDMDVFEVERDRTKKLNFYGVFVK